METIAQDHVAVKAALSYAEQGLRVIPLYTVDGEGHCSCKRPECPTPGKHPRLGNWHVRATTNPYTIRFWWGRDPKANIGIVLGGGLVVIDFDEVAAYSVWRKEHPGLARTLTAKTGGGGYHAYLQVTEPVDTFLHPAGEVRSEGAYVVAPPSRHIAGAYEWINPEAEILIAAPEDLPKHQSAALTPIEVKFTQDEKRRPDLQRWDLSERILELIHHPRPVGQRSEADQAVITALVAAGATDNEIRAVFRHYPIGTRGKYADKGKNADRYLAHSIGKARAYHTEVEAQFHEALRGYRRHLERTEG